MRGNPAMARDLGQRLGRIAGVRRVETNVTTGSVVVLFEESTRTSAEHLERLSETFPALDLEQLRTSGPGNGNGHGTNGSLDKQVVGFFTSINAGVGNVANGIDLKVLVPIVLFFLGVRSLVVSEKLGAPSWYDYFWFGLSTFFMLNAAALKGDGHDGPSAGALA
jgi:hypothetical protein